MELIIVLCVCAAGIILVNGLVNGIEDLLKRGDKNGN